MKQFTKLTIILTMLLLIMPFPLTVSAAAKISNTSVTLTKGQTTTLKVTGTSAKVTWSSSKASVATVSNGKVTAKAKGTATITAKVGKVSYKCKVTVKDQTAQQIVAELSKEFKIKNVKTTSKSNGTYDIPNSYKSKATFTDKKYPKVYCTVEVFEDNWDACQRVAYIQMLDVMYGTFNQAEDVPLVAYRYKNVVVRVNTTMPTSYAKKYYTALKKIVK